MSLLQVAEAGGEGNDILMAMARELVTEKGIGESAAAVWKQLVKRQTEVFGSRDVEAAPLPGDAETAGAIPEPIIIPKPMALPVTQLLMFGDSLENMPKRRVARRTPSTGTRSSQLGLF